EPRQPGWGAADNHALRDQPAGSGWVVGAGSSVAPAARLRGTRTDGAAVSTRTSTGASVCTSTVPSAATATVSGCPATRSPSTRSGNQWANSGWGRTVRYPPGTSASNPRAAVSSAGATAADQACGRQEAG